MWVGEHRTQTFEFVVVMLLVLMFLSPQVHIPYYFWTSGLSTCNLAKVEVEGSSPFFRLSFSLPNFLC